MENPKNVSVKISLQFHLTMLWYKFIPKMHYIHFSRRGTYAFNIQSINWRSKLLCKTADTRLISLMARFWFCPSHMLLLYLVPTPPELHSRPHDSASADIKRWQAQAKVLYLLFYYDLAGLHWHKHKWYWRMKQQNVKYIIQWKEWQVRFLP